MRLPTRVKRRGSFDGAHALPGARRWLALLRKRQFMWVCVACVSLLLLHAVVFPESRVFSASGRRFSARSELQVDASTPLLDGAKIAKQLPLVYPNGDANRFECDLPALRYQCDLDKQEGCKAYPQLFPTGELVRNWSPNNVNPPRRSFSSLCRFNISSPYEFALARVFHEMEVPFVAYGIPELDRATQVWKFDYLREQLGPQNAYRVQRSNSTHFMFFTRRMARNNESAPYDTLWLKYSEFVDAASTADKSKYFYLMLTADDIRGRAPFALNDLGFLDPDKTTYGDFFIRDKEFARKKGMRCRFGMPGIITEGHIDAGLNMVAMARGRKRYILSPPSACNCLGLFSNGPSMRHTWVDWATVTSKEAYPDNFNCLATEAIVGEGDVLYIPSYWYHHIVSLDHTIQCNVRSGIIARNDVQRFLQECGLASF